MDIKRIKIKKINIRMTLYFSVLLILLGIIISVINIVLYSQEVQNQVGNVVMQKMGLISGRLDSELSNITNFHTALINDNQVGEAFRAVVENETKENIDRLTKLLENHHLNQAKSIIAIGINGQLYYSNPLPVYQKLANNNEEFNQIIKTLTYAKFSKPNTVPLEYQDPTDIQKNNITLYGQYYDTDNYDILGYVAINIKKSVIFNSIAPIADEAFSTMAVIDENDNLIFKTGDIQDDVDFSALEQNQNIQIGNKLYTTYTQKLQNYNRWRIVGLLDSEVYKIRTRQLNMIIYGLLLVFIAIMTAVSWLISKRITNPIKEVVSSMKEFEQNRWPEPLTTNNEDEIKDLIVGYNGMLRSFIALTNDIVSRHEENKEMEMSLINTQIDLLEAQINPHFIHNTLNSMNYLAAKDNNQELAKLITSFNQLLRMSMSIEMDFITVMQEVQNLKHYAQIQSVRYEDAFDIQYDIDEEALLAKIPKLILQPLVENSMIHGILPRKKKGIITITIHKQGDDLKVSVKDDGIGFDSKKIDLLLSEEMEGRLSKHIGVKNVRDRLTLYYHENASFSIQSIVGKGVEVVFIIPFEE